MYQATSMRKPTNREVLDYLATLIASNTGVCVSKIVNIGEAPSQLRHSCVATGVTYLYPQQTEQFHPEVPPITYYFCPQCGKLYIYRETF